MANRIIEKVLAGKEDLLFGQGQVEQLRNDVATLITKINASVIPYSGDVNTSNLVSVLEQLNILLAHLTDNKHLSTSIQGGNTTERYHLTLAEKNAIGGAIPDHNDTTNIQGGAADDYQHLSATDVSKLAGIESGATADQTKADIDALGIDADTLDGKDSTDFALAADVGIKNIVEDTTPQLGGQLDCQTHSFLQSNYGALSSSDVSGAFDLDFSAGDMQTLTAVGNVTPSFAGFITNKVCGFILDAVNWGTYTVTWPVGTIFAAGAAPALTAVGKDRLLILKDAANVYTVHVCEQDIKVP